MTQISVDNSISTCCPRSSGALLSYTFGCVRLDWSLIGEPLLILISVFNGAVLIGMAHSRSIWIAYAGYWGYRALYQMLITVASFEIAANIRDDSYGLIFGLNTFLALALQTILTATVADSVGLALPIRTQVRGPAADLVNLSKLISY